MIRLLKRLVRHLRGLCLTCGAQPLEGCAHCWDCSLELVQDWDEVKAAALLEQWENKPSYFDIDNNDE